jgi:hypothetical protein
MLSESGRIQSILNLAPFPFDLSKRGVHARPTLSIILQSTVGGFSAEFMRRLPAVERAMVAHRLDPSQFVISKDTATTPTARVIGPFFHDYTVFFGDDKFTVTEPNDIRFLDYFYQRCVAADQELPSERARPGLISRLVRWMGQTI